MHQKRFILKHFGIPTVTDNLQVFQVWKPFNQNFTYGEPGRHWNIRLCPNRDAKFCQVWHEFRDGFQNTDRFGIINEIEGSTANIWQNKIFFALKQSGVPWDRFIGKFKNQMLQILQILVDPNNVVIVVRFYVWRIIVYVIRILKRTNVC